jgi:hypothetical protein
MAPRYSGAASPRARADAAGRGADAQTLLSGLTVTQYREGIEHIDVVASAVPSERLRLDRLAALTIPERCPGAAVAYPRLALGGPGPGACICCRYYRQNLSRLGLVLPDI